MNFGALLKKLSGRSKNESLATVEPSIRLSCDIGSSKIVFLEILKSAEGVELLKYVHLPKPKEKLSEALTKCREESGFSTHKLRLSLKGQGVIVRFIQFPKMKHEDVKAALTFEAEKYIPFKSDEVIVDFHVLDENASDENMDLLLVAVKREEVYAFIQPFQESGFQIDLIDIDALAGVNALEYFFPENQEKGIAYLDIGTEISTVSVVQKGMPRFIRDVSFGRVDMLKRLKRKLGITEEEALEHMKAGKGASEEAQAVLKESVEDLVTEVKVSIDYYMDQASNGAAIEKLYLSGGSGNLEILQEVFVAGVSYDVASLEIIDKIKIKEGVDEALIKSEQGVLPVALGLALRDL